MHRVVSAPGEAELALAVIDAWQRRGIGRRLVTEAACRANVLGIQRLTARVLPENTAARALFDVAFPIHLSSRDEDIIVLTAKIKSGPLTVDDTMADLTG